MDKEDMKVCCTECVKTTCMHFDTFRFSECGMYYPKTYVQTWRSGDLAVTQDGWYDDRVEGVKIEYYKKGRSN